MARAGRRGRLGRAAPVVIGKQLRRIARFGLAAGGLALLALLVRNVGVARVADVLRQAGSLLPVIVLLELAQMSSDFFALRSLLRSRSVRLPGAAWVRSSAVAYAMMILLPAGRAAGEVARGALVARHAGAALAARASTELQSAYIFANGLASAVAAATVASAGGAGAPLAVLLGINAAAMFALSLALVAVLRDARVGRWLQVRLARLGVLAAPAAPPANPANAGAEVAPTAHPPLSWRAAVICAGGRGAQLLQYGVILHAVGGHATLRAAIVAHGIHLVGATAGDVLPNQVGVVDGAYRAFAGSLGLSAAPARALSIALVARTGQLLVAAVCVAVAALTRQAAAGPRAEAGTPSIREGVRS